MKFDPIRKIKELIDAYDDTHNFTCDLCGCEVFAGERVCADCMKTLPLNNGAICPFCGRKVGEAGACLDCKEKPLGAEKARSVCTHEGKAAEAVLRFKRGARYFCRTFAYLALPVLQREFADADLLTYVPMTKKAFKKRGYNQAELLCAQLARLSGKPMGEVLVKKKETEQQKSLGRREREENLTGCFGVIEKEAVKGKKILLIDDVMTTGATVGEISSVLKKAGAQSVYVLTITSVTRPLPFGKTDGKKKIRPNAP